MSKSAIETFYPTCIEDWRNWLEENYDKKESIWVIFYKKSSTMPSLTWSESVDEALCFGWIDSLKKTVDEQSYRQFFSRRKDKSTWSKINKDKIEILVSEGRMTAAGLVCVELAKQNGSWTYLDSVDAMIIPEDLEIAFKNNPSSSDFYSSLSNSKKKILLYWLLSAKRSQTRENRLNEIVENANNGMLPKAFRN